MPGPIATSGDKTAHASPDRVSSAIARSARATGLDFSYLMGQARIESGLNPHAKARTSSATGLFQFIEQSWLDVMQRHGSKYGLEWASSAINRRSDGRLSVADSGLRRHIMELRKNPEIASLMAGEFASDNRDYLESRLGRRMESVDLYLAHFLGAGGAHKFLSAMQNNPDAAAAPLFSKAARANRNVFYAPGGRARSLSEIRSRFADKLAGAGSASLPGGNGLPQGGKAPPGYVQPADYLRLASRRPAAAEDVSTDITRNYQPGRRLDNENARLAYMLLASMGG